jgi:DNA repair protein RecO (recombination protein O)
MAALAGGDWAGAEIAPDTARREASGLVAALLQWHLERGLRSLAMVDRGVGVPIESPPSDPSTAIKGTNLATGLFS